MWRTHAIAPHSPAEVRGDPPIGLLVFEVAVKLKSFIFVVIFIFPLCKCLDEKKTPKVLISQTLMFTVS